MSTHVWLKTSLVFTRKAETRVSKHISAILSHALSLLHFAFALLQFFDQHGVQDAMLALEMSLLALQVGMQMGGANVHGGRGGEPGRSLVGLCH